MQGVVVSQVYNSARPPLSPPLVNVYTHRVEIGDFYILLYIYIYRRLLSFVSLAASRFNSRRPPTLSQPPLSCLGIYFQQLYLYIIVNGRGRWGEGGGTHGVRVQNDVVL